MATIKYRIMGIPQRNDNINTIKNCLGIDDKDIFIDYECRKNPMLTWKDTATINTDDYTHLCIIQDDAELCNDFKEFCNYLCNKFPYTIFTLQNHKDWSNTWVKYGYIFKPGYVTSALVTIVPKEYITPIIQCWENNWKECTADDQMICYWAHHNNVDVCTTYPTVCDMKQENEGIPSSLGHSENDRHSKMFIKNAMSVKWIDRTKSSSWARLRKWDKPYKDEVTV